MFMSESLADEQQKFAQQMMALEEDVCYIRPKKKVVVKVKRQPRRTIRDIQKDIADAAGLTLTLEAYDASKTQIEKRAELFDTRCFASMYELTGTKRTADEEAAAEERRFVQFLIAERKARNEWIEKQNFPIVEYTEEDEEDERREKEAKTIYFNHLNGIDC